MVHEQSRDVIDSVLQVSQGSSEKAQCHCYRKPAPLTAATATDLVADPDWYVTWLALSIPSIKCGSEQAKDWCVLHLAQKLSCILLSTAPAETKILTICDNSVYDVML